MSILLNGVIFLFRIDEIFKSEETKHRLTLFKTEYIKWLEIQLFEKNGKPYLKCLASDKDRPAKPEEIVRQLWIKKLLEYREKCPELNDRIESFLDSYKRSYPSEMSEL